ncbi:Uracil-DNA glycosylase, family 5 [hydrothermal vent metagenome]|uniref:Type-5 uracil-DNA glycosylase n=1 Tax=hydrothermal vent metagenome TaxID=652676 RepID=A0A3B0T924_9ZZZZ
MVSNPCEPPTDCPVCPRLVAFREQVCTEHRDWHNAPVASFGDPAGQLLIVGLAPGMKGANRTGRPFTGDYAGDLLYKTLIAHRFAHGTYLARPDDGLELTDCLITNAVRCLPPQNKPNGAEIKACRPFLLATMAAMPNLKAVLALGRIAHETFLSAIGARRAAHPFGHNASHKLDGLTLFDSYHCSRYNTNTGRLTEAMFNDVFDAIDRFLNRQSKS